MMSSALSKSSWTVLSILLRPNCSRQSYKYALCAAHPAKARYEKSTKSDPHALLVAQR